MVLGSRDGVDWRLHEEWQAKLLEAEQRFQQDKNAETKAEYMRILRIFKDLVMYGIRPRG
jgi:predicted house-cleaning noncanonical NTP pyrophosphatase (MazG superfamily)